MVKSIILSDEPSIQLFRKAKHLLNQEYEFKKDIKDKKTLQLLCEKYIQTHNPK